MERTTRIILLIACILTALTPRLGLAQDRDDWTIEFSPYFWLAALDGTATVRGFEAEVDQDLGDAWELLSDNFDFAAAAHLEVHNSKWGILADGLYMGLASDGNGPITGQDIDAEFDLIAVELGGFWRVVNESAGTIDLLGGTRINRLDFELNPQVGRTRDSSQNWVDPFVGVRGQLVLNDALAVFARGDIGGFGISDGNTSDLVWNISVGAHVTVSNGFFISVGYRWLDTDYENDDDDFKYDMTAAGPFLATTWRW
jgi:hypothetical protein